MKKNQNIKFEDAMDRLEKIINILQEGNISLDESLSTFEEGIELVRLCQKKLEDTENKITMLIKDSSGEAKEISFDAELED